jgi:hypothetical protein
MSTRFDSVATATPFVLSVGAAAPRSRRISANGKKWARTEQGTAIAERRQLRGLRHAFHPGSSGDGLVRGAIAGKMVE